jgi:uncharacterized metal-binding protein YceD (DUF177 family)
MIRPPARRERVPRRPWSVTLAVSEVPESGRQIGLVAEKPVRSAVARLAGLDALPRLEAAFDLTPHGRGGLHVVGRVSATVGQTCVVTLEPIENEIDEPIDVAFAPDAAPLRGAAGDEIDAASDDVPELLVGGTVDLGAIATEFLLLAIDPYPRKPGAEFQQPVTEDDSAHPFAPLSALKQGRRRGRGGSNA